MKHLILSALLSIVSSEALTPDIIRETDSAFLQSQRIRTEAISAFQATNLPTASTLMTDALALRPNSIALLGNAIFLHAEAGNTETAYHLSERLVAMGMNPGAALQNKLADMLAPEDWLALRQKMIANSQPTGSVREVASIPAKHKLVEGIAAGPNGSYYFSTVVSGSLLKRNTEGEVSILFDGHAAGLGSFFGIAFNPASNTLFATFATIEQTPPHNSSPRETGLVEIDPVTGQLLKKWVLPGDGQAHQIADIAVSKTGTVFVADAKGNTLYRVHTRNLEAIPAEAAFMNLQGLVARKKGDLLVADYGRGIWRINTETGKADLYGVPDTVTVTGIDGLFMHRGRIIAVQNGTLPHRILEINIDDADTLITGVTVLAQNLPVFDEPTLGTSNGRAVVFVAASQWPKFGPKGALREGASLNATTIVEIPDP